MNTTEYELPLVNFLNLEQVAKIFCVRSQTIRRWVREGKFPPGMKAPGGRRWSQAVIEKYIEHGQASSKAVKIVAENAR